MDNLEEMDGSDSDDNADDIVQEEMNLELIGWYCPKWCQIDETTILPMLQQALQPLIFKVVLYIQSFPF